jgi:hypothetical protein
MAERVDGGEIDEHGERGEVIRSSSLSLVFLFI